MKSTIVSPRINGLFAICTVIPFENVEVSISQNNGLTPSKNGEFREWTIRQDLRVYDSSTQEDLTERVFGVCEVYPSSGAELLEHLILVERFDSMYVKAN